MPALAGIIQAERLAGLILHIGQDHHFRMAWRMEQIGDIHFQIAKPLAEGRYLRRFQILLRETKHAIFAKGAQKRAEILGRGGLTQVNPFNPRTQPGIIGGDFHAGILQRRQR